jgi:hypothetical protein
MNPERWKHIDELVQAAFDRPGNERVAFLDEACSGDDDLTNRWRPTDELAQTVLEPEPLPLPVK